MRTRSRTETVPVGGYINDHYTRTHFSPDPPSSFQVTTLHDVNTSYNKQVSTIVDMVPRSLPEIRIDPITHRASRIHYPNLYKLGAKEGSTLFRRGGPYKPIHPCTHTKTQYRFDAVGEFVVEYGANFVGRTDAGTITCPNVRAFTAQYGGPTFANVLAFSPKYSAGSYHKIDWFALMDSFDQSTSEYMHSAFLGGEDIKENEIFVDAFKLLINPTNAIKILLRHAKDFVHSKYVPHLTLGQMARSYHRIAKKGAEADLFYKFAVRPAIKDIKDLIDSHSKVRDRMDFLRQNSGTWVPIRVKQELFSSGTNSPPGSLAPGVATQWFSLLDFKRSTGIIGGYGRIRPDLDWNGTWTAYAQYFGIDHIVGLAWELIPFSFVVDWFTNAQERIDYYTRLRTGGPFSSIRAISASLKTETQLSLWMNPGYMSSVGYQITNPVNATRVATYNDSVYNRYTSIPETSGVVDLSTLGLFHGVTAGELILQKWL